eukprot:635298_1
MENMLFFLETAQWIEFISSLNPQNPHSMNAKELSTFNELYGIKFPDNVPKSKIIESPVTNVGGVVLNLDGTVHSNKEEKEKRETAVRVHEDVNETGLTDEDKVYFSAVKIFRKYVINQAYFCINISFEHRAKLYSLFGWDDSKQSMDSVMVKHLKVSILWIAPLRSKREE